MLKKDNIIAMLRQLEKTKVITEVNDCSESYVLELAWRNRIYSRVKVGKEIKSGKSNDEISSQGNVDIDAIQRVREELKRKEEKGPEYSPKMLKLLEDLYEIIDFESIKKHTGYSTSYISRTASERGIYARQKVKRAIINGMSNEEIARVGHVNIDAVQRVREELKRKEEEEEQKRIKSSKRESASEGKKSETDKIIDELREVKSLETIGAIYGVTEEYVKSIAKQNGIYMRPEVEKAIIQGTSNEEIASVGHVNIDAIQKVRRTIKITKLKILKPNEEKLDYSLAIRYREQEQNDEDINDKKMRTKSVLPKVEIPKQKEFIELARKFESVQTIMDKTGLSQNAIYLSYQRNGIYTRNQVFKLIREGKLSDTEIANIANGEIEAISELRKLAEELDKLPLDILQQIIIEVQKEFSSTTIIYRNLKGKVSLEAIKEIKYGVRPKKSREERYNDEMKLLRNTLTNYNEKMSDYVRSTKLQTLGIITELFSDLITKLDYAYLAYQYIIIGEASTAFEIGKKYLDLNDLTEKGLRNKIYEVINETKQDRNTAKKEQPHKNLDFVGENR